jgi:hypothetical protein
VHRICLYSRKSTIEALIYSASSAGRTQNLVNESVQYLTLFFSNWRGQIGMLCSYRIDDTWNVHSDQRGHIVPQKVFCDVERRPC